MRASYRTFLLFATVILAGCNSSVSRYASSPENVLNMREAKRNIALGTFTGEKGSVFCNGLMFYAEPNHGETENKDAYALYVRQAFEQEIASAKIDPSMPSLMVSAKLLNVDASCRQTFFNLFYWVLEAEVTIAGWEPYIVKTRLDMKAKGRAPFLPPTEDEIHNVARTSFPQAVQMLIAGITTHPTFISAFQTSPKAN